jgi:hypothetical protein
MTALRAAPIQHNKLNHFLKLVEAMPIRECRYVVFSNKVINRGVGFALSNFFHGVDCVGGRRSAQFAIVKRKSFFVFYGRSHHRQSHFSAGRGRIFKRGGRCRNENDLFQVELFPGRPSQNQMSVMNWVERASADSDLSQCKNASSQSNKGEIARRQRFLFSARQIDI